MKKINFQNNISNTLLVIKALLILCIIVSPFVPSTSFSGMNHMATKVLFLIVIVVACFVDFQLALILTIAFLILIIHVNSTAIGTLQQHTNRDTFVNQVERAHQKKEASQNLNTYFVRPDVQRVEDDTKNIVCEQPKLNDINKHLMSIYVDEKIKPYDVYVAMITNEEQLAKAQGELI